MGEGFSRSEAVDTETDGVRPGGATDGVPGDFFEFNVPRFITFVGSHLFIHPLKYCH